MLKPYTNAGKSGLQSLNSSRAAKGLPEYDQIGLSKAQKILNNAYALQKRALNSSLLPTSIIPSATQPGDVLQKTTYMNVLRAVLVDWLIPEFCTMQPMASRHTSVPYTLFHYGEDKGNVKAGQVFASPFELSRGEDNYSGSDINNEPLTDLYLRAPVIPTTVRITTPTETVFDDGEGKLQTISGTTVTDVGTIDYATGVITGVTASATTYASYRVDNISASANTPPIYSSLEWLDLVAEDQTLAARWSMAAAYDMETQYGLDGPKMLEEQATSQIVNELNTKVAHDMFVNAGAGQPVVWSATPPIGQGQAGDLAHDNSFIRAINAGSQRIYDATGRLRPNFMLVGSSVMTVIQGMTLFKAASTQKTTGSYYAGTLGDKKVYCFRGGIPHDQYVLGHVSSNDAEPSYIFGTYMPVTATSALMDATFTGQQGFATSNALKMVNPKAFIRGVVTNLVY
jgi:hypothetical protein